MEVLYITRDGSRAKKRERERERETKMGGGGHQWLFINDLVGVEPDGLPVEVVNKLLRVRERPQCCLPERALVY